MSISCITPQTAKALPQIKLTIAEKSSTDTNVTYSILLQYIATSAPSTNSDRSWNINFSFPEIASISGTYDIDRVGTYTIYSSTFVVSKSKAATILTVKCSMEWNITWSGVNINSTSAQLAVTIPKKTSYVIKYNANGGGGEPTSVTKYHDETITIPNTTPTNYGYSFLKWSLTLDDGNVVYYKPGDFFGRNLNATLYAVWSPNIYTVTYDTQGGVDAPASQTVEYGAKFTLPNATPTKEYYIFDGWYKFDEGSNSGAGAYYPGEEVYITANCTFRAVWKTSYTRPIITNAQAFRCVEDGTESDEGTYANISFNWETCIDITSIDVIIICNGAAVRTITTTDVTGTSGLFSAIVGDGQFDTSDVYKFTLRVNDQKGNEYLNIGPISVNSYPIDFYPSQRSGVGFGTKCYAEGTANFSYRALFQSDATFNDIVRFYADAFSNSTIEAYMLKSNILYADQATFVSLSPDHLWDADGYEITNNTAIYETEGIDPNLTMDPFILTHLNTPNGSYMYIMTVFYSSKLDQNNRFQIAFPYRTMNGIYYRYYYDGVWSRWYRVSGHKYSNTEEETGDLWIDNKPIYRRTFTVTCKAGNEIQTAITDVDQITNFEGVFVNSSGGTRPINCYISDTRQFATWQYNKSRGDFSIRVIGENGTAYVTLYYTKTTD